MSDPLRLARAALDDSDADDLLSPLCRRIVNGEYADVKPKRDDDRAQLLGEIAALTKRIAALEKRGTSRNKKISKADMELLASAIGKCLGEELQPLEKRLAELEARSELKWAGIWSDGTRYNEGSLITDKGSLWSLRQRAIALVTMHPPSEAFSCWPMCGEEF